MTHLIDGHEHESVFNIKRMDELDHIRIYIYYPYVGNNFAKQKYAQTIRPISTHLLERSRLLKMSYLWHPFSMNHCTRLYFDRVQYSFL